MKSIVLPQLQFIVVTDRNAGDIVLFIEPTDKSLQLELAVYLLQKIDEQKAANSKLTLEMGSFRREWDRVKSERSGENQEQVLTWNKGVKKLTGNDER